MSERAGRQVVIKGRSASEAADTCHALHRAGITPAYQDIISDTYSRFLQPGDIAACVANSTHLDRIKECVGADGHVVELSISGSTLDLELYDFKRLAFIRVGESSEALTALEGALSLVDRTRPILSIAYNERPRSLHTWAAATGYCISDLWGNLVRSEDELLYVCSRSCRDFFLVPQEAAVRWAMIFL